MAGGPAEARPQPQEWKTTDRDCESRLSYEPTNSPERLYSSEGFIPGELADWGERIATLDLTKL